MKIVIAPDSFKGSLSAARLADIVADEALAAFPAAEVVRLPIADGGEGTLDAIMQATRGEIRVSRVHDPIGREISARWGLTPSGQAVIELAEAAGITLLDKLDPLNASTYGVGEIILAALDAGAREMLIGIGGSATNDGGAGLLEALGADFGIRASGGALAQMRKADFSGLDARLREAKITVLCDVTNPLLGPRGATMVYGPQKGANAETLRELEAGMEHYARLTGFNPDVPGAGAAGGAGFALIHALHAQMLGGADAVMDVCDFDNRARGADLVITGEGRVDFQSVKFMKAAAKVKARAMGAPVIALVGGVGDGGYEFLSGGNAQIVPIVDSPMSLSEALDKAPELARRAAERIFAIYKFACRR